jgi:hypothetical protein
MGKRTFTTLLNKAGLDDNRNLSKQEERDIIQTLQRAFSGTGNYLEQLFSQRLVDWVHGQITWDHGCDLHNDWLYESNVGDRLKKERDDLRKEFDAHKDNTRLVVEQLENRIETSGRLIDELANEVADLRRQNQALVEDTNKANGLRNQLKMFLMEGDK